MIALVAAATALSAAIAGYGVVQLRSLAPAAPPATPAPPRQVTALGRIAPAGEIVQLAAPLALDGDRVGELRVREGDRVAAGQVLAVLSSRDRLAALEQEALERVRVAQAALDRVLAGAKPSEIRTQRAEIGRLAAQSQGDQAEQTQALRRIAAQLKGDRATQQATIRRLQAQLRGDRAAQTATIAKLQAEVANAEAEAARYQALFAAGADTASRYDSKRLALATARQQLAEAQVNRDRTERTTREQLAEARAALERTETTGDRQLAESRAVLERSSLTGRQQLAGARANLETIAQVRPVDVQAARAELAAARAAHARTRTELEQAVIRAPNAGTILKIYAHAGEKVTEDGLLALAATDRMVAIAEVYQSDIAKVRPGQTVTVTGQGFSGSLRGRVERLGRQVDRQAVFSNQPGENLDRRIVEVRVAIDPADSPKVANLSNLQVEVTIAADIAAD